MSNVSINHKTFNDPTVDTLTATTVRADNFLGKLNSAMSIISTGQLLLQSSSAAANAIRIFASNTAGGIDIDAGTNGVAMDTTGGLSLDSSSTTAASNLSTVGAAGVDLTVSSTAGSVVVSGGEAAADAIQLTTSNAAGGVDVNAGTGGVAVDTTGGLSLDSTSTTVASNLTTVGAAGVDLTVSSTAGSVVVDGGEAAADAVQLTASDTAGGITLSAGSGGVVFPKSTVTQITSITTGVTIDDVSGVITTVTATTAGEATDSFVVTNNRVLASSVVLVSLDGYSGTLSTNGLPLITVTGISAGSFTMNVSNAHGTAALSGTLDIGFVVH